MKRGNWTDKPCFYVSIIDGDKFNVVAGPYKTHKKALEMVAPAKNAGREHDARSFFYAWGTAKMDTGHRDGLLNPYL